MKNPINTLQTLRDIGARIKGVVSWNRESTLLDAASPTGKFMRHYNQAEAIRATGCHEKNIGEYCAKLDIDPRDGQRWRINLADVQRIRQLVNGKNFKRAADQELAVITVSSLKGGASKTVSSVTLATGLATECLANYRIGVIDLDPQSTATAILNPLADETYISVGDLMMDAVELDAGETFEDACRHAFVETNVPNLRLLPAKDSDREYELLAEERKMKGHYVAYKDLQRIIDAVADDFDIIIIDTSPQFSTATLSAHYVANSLIIPLKPTENDRDATHKYLQYLAQMYELLAGLGHPGYDSVRILLSCIRSNSATIRAIANEIRGVLGSHCFTTEIPESEAVLTCAKQYCTVFDLSPHEYTPFGSRRTLTDAQERFGELVKEVEATLQKKWGL
jgi:cellulose biosynthesis protein BcsQ